MTCPLPSAKTCKIPRQPTAGTETVGGSQTRRRRPRRRTRSRGYQRRVQLRPSRPRRPRRSRPRCPLRLG
eukprot:scaffold50735_cov74-Phaeocystis_antarctica.AAC.1